MSEVYASVDRDADGFLLKDELREGLRRCEIHGLDNALERVLQVVSTSDDGSLQLAAFESMLSRLKLAQLLSLPTFSLRSSPSAGDDAVPTLTVLDYNEHTV